MADPVKVINKFTLNPVVVDEEVDEHEGQTLCDKCDNWYDDDDYGYCWDCEACHECGYHKESCECESFGLPGVVPWEKRGLKPKNVTHKSEWELIWPEIDTSIDPIQAAGSFYLLEGMVAGAIHPIPGVRIQPANPIDPEADERFFKLYGVKTKKAQRALVAARNRFLVEQAKDDPVAGLQSVMGRAEQALDALVDRLDSTLVAYSHMAISGELRHHTAYQQSIGHTDRTVAWCGWRNVYHTVGNQGLLDAATMFYEFSGGSYGGPPWANCCETLYARLEGKLGPNERMNKRMFVDRFWTLEHNGGCFINKIEWSVVNDMDWHHGNMKTLLNAHGAEPMDVGVIVPVVDKPTRKLYEEYVEYTNLILGARKLTLVKTPGEIVDLKRQIKLCRLCYSNITLGHYEDCKLVKKPSYYNFKESDIPNKSYTDWFNTYNLNEITGSAAYDKFIESEKVDLPWGPNLKGPMDGTTKMTVTMTAVVDDDTFGHRSNVKVVETTVQDIVDGKIKFYPKKLFPTKKKGQSGDVKPVNYLYYVNVTWMIKDEQGKVVKTYAKNYDDCTNPMTAMQWYSAPMNALDAGPWKVK